MNWPPVRLSAGVPVIAVVPAADETYAPLEMFNPPAETVVAEPALIVPPLTVRPPSVIDVLVPPLNVPPLTVTPPADTSVLVPALNEPLLTLMPAGCHHGALVPAHKRAAG